MTGYLRSFAILLIGAAILGAMQISAPSYDDAFRPLVSRAQGGQIAKGRLFDARFTDWTLAEAVFLPPAGAGRVRRTDGVFLIAGFELTEVRQTLAPSPVWLGSSGRRYAASARFQGSALAPDLQRFNPHAPNQARVAFELPPDEVAGGQLVLAARGVNILDSELHLSPPDTAPPRQPLYEAAP